MVRFLDEKEAERKRQILEAQMISDPTEESYSYTSQRINWVEDVSDGYDSVEHQNKEMLMKELGKEGGKLFFLGHARNTIKGKPQLIENSKRKIVLLRVIQKSTKSDIVTQVKLLGDLYDKRYDGHEKAILSFDFWMYKITSEEGKDYFILSEEKLPNETCEFSGMLIELDDFAEVSRSMRIKSISNVFILKDFNPVVKIFSKEELISITKSREITERKWLDFLSLHPNDSFNRFPEETELLRSSFILSGKSEGYPLHLAIMGRTGTKKTMGHVESIGYKFSEDPLICEGANSRIKGLSPSFKEKPANVGYLAKQERMAWIDELGKMIEQEDNKHQQQGGNHLGELNFLLEHKKRLVGSGNDNETQVQATSKVFFVTNPVNNKETLQDHVGKIDPTMMSRILWSVQDDEETRFLLSDKSISPYTYTRGIGEKEDSLEIVLGENREFFLSLFDTCYRFVCDVDPQKIQELINKTLEIAKEPMRSRVWKPRAFHHVKLLVDGLCKHRCLFKDYDPTFTPKQEDYTLAEKVLTRVVKSWDTNFNKRWEVLGNV